MSIGGLNAVTAVLLADTKEFSAKMDEAQAKMEEFGAASDSTSSRFTSFGSKLATGVLAAGAAFTAFAVDEGYKFTESMDQLQNATGLTDKQLQALQGTIFKISDATGSSTEDLATAMANIEQAGIRGAKATKLLDDAAKAALATNTNVVQTTQAIVAVQSLQIAKGMDVTKLTGILVAGSHDFVGGLQGEVAMLQGKVGVALANYGVGLKTSIALGATFAKVGLPTRSITSFVNGLGKLEAPLKTVSDSTGTLETGFSSYYEALKQVGLSQSKLESDIRSGNLAGLFLQIKDAAEQAHEPVSLLFNTVFGTSGGAAANLLSKSSGAIEKVSLALKGAGGASLNTAFNTAADQFGNKIKIIGNQLKNDAAQFGLILIPSLSKAATFLENALTSLEKHPAERKVLEIDLGVTVAAALGLKIAQALQSTTQTSLLSKIAVNTGLSAKEGAGSDVEGGAGDVGLLGAGSVASKFGTAVGVFAAGAIAFEATSEFFKTTLGKRVGGVLTAGGEANPINDLAGAIAGLTGQLAHPTAQMNAATLAKDKYDIAHPKKKGTVTINHTTKVGLH